MKTFEMPKMNVAIFSLEDVITTSTGEGSTTKNLEAAQAQLAANSVSGANTTTVTAATDWIAAN